MSRSVIAGRFVSSGGLKAAGLHLLRSTAAVVLSAGGLVAGFIIAASPAAASATTLYAYPPGTGSPTGCPQSSTPADQCSLTEALAQVAPGGTIILAVSGTEGTTSTYYIGNFTFSTAGTSSAEPVTIEPADGTGNAILDGNGGNSSGCPTSACNGPVLSVASGVYASISGVTIQGADNTTTPYGGGLYNSGILSVTNSIFSGDSANRDGGAIDNGDYRGNGTVTVTNSTFSDDSAAEGGAIDNGDDGGNGTVTVKSSAFSNDSATLEGGAIDNGDNGSGAFTATSSTFSGDSSSDNGGAIDNGADGGNGTLTVTGSTFLGDSAYYDGGAINSANAGNGTLTVKNSTFSGDSSGINGGAIDNADYRGKETLTVTGSTFSGDSDLWDGGAIDNGDDGGNGTATVTRSTFAGNSAYYGGAIDNGNNGGTGTATVTSSTFVGDSAANGEGGAIENGGALATTSSTFVGSSANGGGAIFNSDTGTAALAADILAGTSGGGECYGTISDSGYNVDDDGSCGFHATGSVSDSPAINGYLGTLGNYGGPTEAVPLLAISTSSTPEGPDPAFDVIPATVTVPGSSTTICSLPDQRGVVRFVPCDMGAFELWPITNLYAYPAGTGSPAGCAQSSTQADQCSLAKALGEVQPGDTVILAVSGTEGTPSTYYVGNFTLSTAGTSSEEPVTIKPAKGAGNAILDGNLGRSESCPTTACDRPVLTVSSGVYATVSGVTIQDANNTATENGGGISNDGTLTVARSTFSGDYATDGEGGAISNGDLYGNGTLIVLSSTFSGDFAAYGGAIANGDSWGTGVLAVARSTFSGDSATGDGGAISNGDYGNGTLRATNSTFSRDSASYGGAIDNGDAGSGALAVTSSTFARDSATAGGAAIYNHTGTAAFSADIMAGGEEGGECQGVITDDGYNVDDDGYCGLQATGSVSDSPAIDGYLGGLGSYGGPTQTVPLLALSLSRTHEGADPAFAAIPASATVPESSTAICSLPDQRGVVRDTPCDMGAFELLATTTAITSTTSKPVVGQPITVDVTVAPVAPGRGSPTGKVTISDNTYNWTCTLTASSHGKGSCKISERVSGTFSLTASYTGNVDFATSTSTAATSVTVRKDSTTTAITATTFKPLVGEPITVSVKVTPLAPGAGDPTGKVTVSDGKQACTFTLSLSSSSKGSCKITERTAGRYSLTASYAGDRNFSSSKTTAATVITVGTASTTAPGTVRACAERYFSVL